MSSIFHASISYAAIPPMQAVGIYEVTKDNLKDVSPLWGFIALHGKMLESIRFFGNYEWSKDKQGRDISLSKADDPISQLIYLLFPSTDGVSFTANTNSGFVGEILSKNLYIIGNLIDVLCSVQAQKITEKELIAQLENALEQPTMAFHILINILKSEEGLDNILSQFNQKMLLLRGNQYQELLSSYNESLQQKGKQIPFVFFLTKLLTKIRADKKKSGFNLEKSVKDLIKSQSHQLAQQVVGKLLLNSIVLGGLKKDKDTFLQTLTRAFLMEQQGLSAHYIHPNNNSMINKIQPSIASFYPRNIVAYSLLAFFVKVDNSRSDLNKLAPSLLQKKIRPEGIFGKGDYYREKKNLPSIKNNPSLLDPESLFLLSEGYEFYENSFKEDTKFRWGTSCYMPKGGKTIGNNLKFPDCGENSLRNLFTLLLPSTNGKVDLTQLQQQVPDLNDRFIGFFTRWPSAIPVSHEKAHNEWADILFKDDNVPYTGIDSIQYARYVEDQKEQGINPDNPDNNCDINPAHGILNMLNVVAKLIPDPILKEPWNPDQKEQNIQATHKLNRLCDLLSGSNHLVSWHVRGQKVINSIYETITFSVNNKDGYEWNINKGHFDFSRIPILSQNDWRALYKEVSWPNEWVASLFNYFSSTTKSPSQPYLPYHLIYRPSLKTVDGVIATVTFLIRESIENFYPLSAQWIKKQILEEYNDPHVPRFHDQKAIVKFASALLKENLENIITFLKTISNVLSLQDFSRVAGELAFSSLVKKNDGSVPGMFGPYIYNKDGRSFIQKLIEEHLIDVNIQNDNGYVTRGLLHEAAGNGDIDTVEMLLEKNADVNIKKRYSPSMLALHGRDDDSSFTPLYEAVNNGPHRDVINALVLYGADLEAEESLIAPILKSGKDLDLVEFFLENGARVQKKDVEVLLEQYSKDSNQEDLRNKYEEIFNLFTQKGFDGDAKDWLGRPLIFSAVDTNNSQFLEAFFDNGADVESIYKDKGLLEYAISNKNVGFSMIKVLIENGVLIYDQDLINLLYMRSDDEKNISEVVDIFKKLDVITRDLGGGYTPLHYAVYYANENLVKAMLENGADPTAKTQYGYTPLQLLNEKLPNFEAIKLILQKPLSRHLENEEKLTPMPFKE